jgi:hypothetical protein
MTRTGTPQSRGIRNNNPGNIVRTAEKWQGMAPDQSSDGRFVVFVDVVWGLRALVKVLRSYRRRGLVTVRQMIGAYAPPAENNTGVYIDHVARCLRIGPDDPVRLDDPDVLHRLMRAITLKENGSDPYEDAIYAEAIRRAGDA